MNTKVLLKRTVVILKVLALPVVLPIATVKFLYDALFFEELLGIPGQIADAWEEAGE